MDYLQYLYIIYVEKNENGTSFKPCYKWITFNIESHEGTVGESTLMF